MQSVIVARILPGSARQVALVWYPVQDEGSGYIKEKNNV